MDSRLIKQLEDRQEVFGTVVGIDSAIAAETLAKAGYDFLFLDQQHGAIDDATLLRQIQAVQGAQCITLVRLSWNDSASIMQALDYGADGIVAPLIDSEVDAARLVSAMRFPPVGMRSYGPFRAGLPDQLAYKLRANDAHSAIAMIETKAALHNLDKILGVAGLDAVFVGPLDLSLSLGCSGESMTKDGGYFSGVLKHIARRAASKGVVAGCHCSDASTARQLVEIGYRFVTIKTDLSSLFEVAKMVVCEVRS